jgi:hypothetical protein
MTVTEAKKRIDSTGEAYLTLINDTETLFVGQVDRMTTKDGRVKLSWKLPAVEHVSAFNRALISGAKKVYSLENIYPIRLDVGQKRYEVNWDV